MSAVDKYLNYLEWSDKNKLKCLIFGNPSIYLTSSTSTEILSLLLAAGSMAQADTCGSVEEAISTTREMLRQSIIFKIKKSPAYLTQDRSNLVGINFL